VTVPEAPASRGHHGLLPLASLSLVLGLAGLCGLWNYTSAPGDSGVAAERWPASVPVALAPAGLTLVVLAHPRCPCTRSTLAELDRLMARCPRGLHARVLFFVPEGQDQEWAHSDLWKHASSIPGVTVAVDEDGRAARSFGAETSGQVLVYDAKGALLFHGGITPGRGHEGASLGWSAIVDLVETGVAVHSGTPVFGCPIDEARGAEVEP
jgi:hypothetical protein